MLHKEIPFLRICIPLCAGIVAGVYTRPALPFLLVSGSVILLIFLASLFFNRQEYNRIFGFAITSAWILTGLLLSMAEKNRISVLEQVPSVLAGTLSDYPEEKTNSYMLKLKLYEKITRENSQRVSGSILIYLRKDSSAETFLPGDRLLIRCTPKPVADMGNPYEFSYRFYAESHGIRYSAFARKENILVHSKPVHRNIAHKALILREKIIRMYEERGITGDRLALVAAITLGQKNMLDPDQKSYFIKAGVMHIMAVSGLHTVILSLFVFNLLFFLKKRYNIARVILTLVILWFFALITGLTPSVLRATLMFSFLQSGKLLRRPVNGINSVLASAFLLIIIHPSVIFDAGFLLSYSAVIYIIAFFPLLYQKLLFRNWLADKIWQSVVITLVAQAGTLPLTISLFNRFPLYFILTNLIIVPLSSLLVITGCLIPIFFPLRFISFPMALAMDKLTALTQWLTMKASELPLASVENIGMTTAECILLTVVIFLFTLFFLKRESVSPVVPLSALALYALTSSANGIATRITNEVIVYNTRDNTEIGIRTGRSLNLISDTIVPGREVMRHCSTLGLELRMHPAASGNTIITAAKSKILITRSQKDVFSSPSLPDIVILLPGGLKRTGSATSVHNIGTSGAFSARL